MAKLLLSWVTTRTHPRGALNKTLRLTFKFSNRFLRWKAIQDVLFVDPVDGKEKIWSESNVSEDFDMALRLMLEGYIIRSVYISLLTHAPLPHLFTIHHYSWATYSEGAFKEGVSLSVDDELNRWQKYAYGCSEQVCRVARNYVHVPMIT